MGEGGLRTTHFFGWCNMWTLFTEQPLIGNAISKTHIYAFLRSGGWISVSMCGRTVEYVTLSLRTCHAKDGPWVLAQINKVNQSQRAHFWFGVPDFSVMKILINLELPKLYENYSLKTFVVDRGGGQRGVFLQIGKSSELFSIYAQTKTVLACQTSDSTPFSILMDDYLGWHI